jgi:hypothetical protein
MWAVPTNVPGLFVLETLSFFYEENPSCLSNPSWMALVGCSQSSVVQLDGHMA